MTIPARWFLNGWEGSPAGPGLEALVRQTKAIPPSLTVPYFESCRSELHPVTNHTVPKASYRYDIVCPSRDRTVVWDTGLEKPRVLRDRQFSEKANGSEIPPARAKVCAENPHRLTSHHVRFATDMPDRSTARISKWSPFLKSCFRSFS